MNYPRQLPIQYLDLCPTIDQKYKVLFKLGSGRFSKVKMGLKLATNQRVAIKIMNHKIQQNDIQRRYEQKTLQMFLSQVRICLQAKHKNIVQIIDFNVGGVYRTTDGKVYRIMYYVMKIAQNGQLFRLINQTEIFSEKTARYIFRQLIAGIKHLHNKGFAHCDIKAQNVLVDQKLNIKIADFGFSREFISLDQNKINFNSSDSIGTAKCNAPQLINEPNSNSYHADQIDVFACGCLLFQLVMKSQPFKTSDLKDQYYNKLAANQKGQFWEIFSSKCKPSNQFKGTFMFQSVLDIIQRLLNPNPKARITVEQIYKHPWILGQTVSKPQYKKQLSSRLKKVLVKVRKQQQSQIKKFFTKQRSKNNQILKIEQFQLNLRKQFEQRIREIKHLLTMNQASCSDSSSSPDAKDLRERDRQDQFSKICPYNPILKGKDSKEQQAEQ